MRSAPLASALQRASRIFFLDSFHPLADALEAAFKSHDLRRIDFDMQRILCDLRIGVML